MRRGEAARPMEGRHEGRGRAALAGLRRKDRAGGFSCSLAVRAGRKDSRERAKGKEPVMVGGTQQAPHSVLLSTHKL